MAETKFNAFLSYSKRENEPLARALHGGLHRLAKPWHELRAVQVFRDAHDLSASASLKGSIRDALLASEYFILIASPASARSRWVKEEIDLWRRNKPSANVLLVLAGGELCWDPQVGDFDWAVTTALPQAEAERWFDEEPLWVDVRELPDTDLRMRNPAFQDVLATLSAPLRGCSKAQLVSADLRLHRRAVRVRRTLVTGLALLSIVAVGSAVVAWQQRDEARAQARRALSRSLAAASADRSDDDPQLAIRLGLQAYSAEPTPEAKAQLMRLTAENAQVTGFVRRAYQTFPGGESGVTVKRIVLSPDGHTAALLHQGLSDALIWDTRHHRLVAALPAQTGWMGANIAPFATFDESGRILTISDVPSGVATTWQLPSGKLLKTGSASTDFASYTDEPSSLPPLPKECRFRGRAHPQAPWRPWAVSDKTQRLVVVCEGGNLRLWDTRNGKQIAVRQLSTEVSWTATALSADGMKVSVGDSDGNVIGLTSDLAVEQQLTRHSNSVSDIVMNGDGSVILSTSDVGDVIQTSLGPGIQMTDVAAGTTSDLVTTPAYSPIVASPDGRQVVTLRSDGVTLWDVERRTGRTVLTKAAQAVSFSRDSRRFALLTADAVTVRDARSLKVLERFAVGGDEAVRALAASTGWFRIIDSRANATSLNSGPSVVTAIWPGGQHVLSRTPDIPKTSVTGRFTAVATPEGKDGGGAARGWKVAVWGWDGSRAPTVEWRTRTARDVSALAVSDDGDHVVIGDVEDRGEIIHRSDPQRPQSLEGGNTVSGMSHFVVAADEGAVVQHTDSVRQGADERNSHNQLLIWDLGTGRLLGSWEEPISSIARGQSTELALIEDDERVATVRPHGHLGLWSISPARWRSDLCRLTDGKLTSAQRERYLDGIDVPAPCPN